MTRNGDENIASELNSRLDTLFSDPDEPDSPEPPPYRQSGETDGRMDRSVFRKEAPPDASDPPRPGAEISQDSPLFELNAIILSIDWEITDETMSRLLEEIERLKEIYRNQKLPLMFLQLHGSVGKYISTRKASAHPDSIKLLHSIYAGLHMVLESADMDEAQKKKILSAEVDKFKKLKEQILIAKTDGLAARSKRAPLPPEAIQDREAAAAGKAESPVLQDTEDAMAVESATAGQDRIQEAVEELKKIIRDEIGSLKEELRALKSR